MHIKHFAPLIALLLFCYAITSTAEVYRCKGSMDRGMKGFDVRLDIVLLDEQDNVLTLSTRKGQFKDIVDIYPVGTGQLEITETLEIDKETQKPSQ